MKHHATCLLAAVVVALMSGCGDSGPARYDVEGTVTYKGEPVPLGVIEFMPDYTQGNKGPAGHAEIRDGRFSTSLSGQGQIGGPHIININAYDGQAKPESELPMGMPLFVGYTEKREMPAEETTLEIAVPEQRRAPVTPDGG